jgi:PIN domain nuclease of toxin-antitoxin system
MDACAMIAFLRGEQGSDIVQNILDASNRSFAHAINVCEVYYDFVRRGDRATARSAVHDLTTVGVHIRHDLQPHFWMRVGELKGTLGRISLADCFAIQLSRVLRAQVVTSDHHEFDRLTALGACDVLFTFHSLMGCNS